MIADFPLALTFCSMMFECAGATIAMWSGGFFSSLEESGCGGAWSCGVSSRSALVSVSCEGRNPTVARAKGSFTGSVMRGGASSSITASVPRPIRKRATLI